MQAREPDGSARRASKAAGISMTLFVVWARPPLCSSTTPSSQQRTAAHPPGPGLPWHAPSVQTSTSPGAASGRWPGSDLDRRRGLTDIGRDSTIPRTRNARVLLPGLPVPGVRSANSLVQFRLERVDLRPDLLLVLFTPGVCELLASLAGRRASRLFPRCDLSFHLVDRAPEHVAAEPRHRAVDNVGAL